MRGGRIGSREECGGRGRGGEGKGTLTDKAVSDDKRDALRKKKKDECLEVFVYINAPALLFLLLAFVVVLWFNCILFLIFLFFLN